jgi:hypothetical protein
MPRLLSRALLVLGAATAATAAAWLISSATASADTLPSVVSPSPAAVAAGSTSGAPFAATNATGSTAANTAVSKTDDANKPFETGLSSAVSTVADPVADAGSTAVDVVTEPSQHAVLPLPASLPVVPGANPAGLDQLTNGLRATVGRLGNLPVGSDLPAQLVGHLANPVAPAVPGQPTSVTGKNRPAPQSFSFAAARHDALGGQTGHGADQHATGSLPLAPAPGSSPLSPLTVPATPGNGGGSGSGFAAPAGLGLGAGNGSQFFPELHVVDVFSPATELAPVMPGKQPGVTPD